MVKDAKALDDLGAVIELDEPHAAFLADIAGAFPIIPAHIWEQVGDPQKFSGEEAVIGTGPFKLESYSKTQGTYSYVANQDYFLGRPKISNIQYVAVGDRVLALKK